MATIDRSKIRVGDTIVFSDVCFTEREAEVLEVRPKGDLIVRLHGSDIKYPVWDTDDVVLHTRRRRSKSNVRVDAGPRTM